MNNTWLMVADVSSAKIFNLEKGRALSILKQYEEQDNRKHLSDLTADLPGRTFNSAADGGRHSMEARTTHKEQGAKEFARKLCNDLDSFREKGDFDKLVLAASPSFLGELRKNMSHNTSRLISTEITKNLTALNNEEILKHLPERI